jgi:hypothetical protein
MRDVRVGTKNRAARSNKETEGRESGRPLGHPLDKISPIQAEVPGTSVNTGSSVVQIASAGARNPRVGWSADACARVAGALRRDLSYEPRNTANGDALLARSTCEIWSAIVGWEVDPSFISINRARTRFKRSNVGS